MAIIDGNRRLLRRQPRRAIRLRRAGRSPTPPRRGSYRPRISRSTVIRSSWRIRSSCSVGTADRTAAWAAATPRPGARPTRSMAWHAQRSSMARQWRALVKTCCAFRAEVMPIDTWSSRLAEVGIESTTAGNDSTLFSFTRLAEVTWAIMNPECRPGSRVRNAGRPDRAGSISCSTRRSEILGQLGDGDGPKKSRTIATGWP